MATMVARGSSPLASSVPSQEKGSRNKRKFRADPPIADPNFISQTIQADLQNYEFLPMDKPLENLDRDHHLGVCNICQNHVCGAKEVEPDDFPEVDWSDLAKSQLEESVLSNLDMIFKTAIKMIMSHGYTEEFATNGVLRSGVFYGCKDTVTNIAENALVFLRSGQELGSSLHENSSDELKRLERSVLAEMVSVLREMRPSFSVGNAMWCLLISDMNVTHACAIDYNALTGTGCEMMPAGSTASQPEKESNSGSSSSQTIPEVNASAHCRPNSLVLYPQNTSQTEMPAVTALPNLPSWRFTASNNSQDSSFDSAKDTTIASLERVTELTASITLSSLPEMKSSGGKKWHMSSSKRESILRQKSAHLEKSYRMFGSEAAARSGKHGLGGLLLDKKCKSVTDSNAMNMKGTMMKLNKPVVSDSTQADPPLNLSISDTYINAASSNPPPVAVANTELSLSLPATSPRTDSNCGSSSIEASFPSERMYGNWNPKDKKDDMLLMLVPRVRELQAQLQDWTNWGQQKVMQAARRLGKDKPELQSLRQDKEEVTRLKKEKQALEENTRKKLVEMEIAFSRAAGQIETTNAAARILQLENAGLRKEMEAAKLRAEESAASCEEVSSREITPLKKFQSWERQKALFHVELACEKRKLTQLRQQLEQAKEYHNQFEARRKREEKAKDEALLQAISERKERERTEVSGRSKESAMRLKAETDLKRYKDEVKKLEQLISQLRLRTDSSKIAALKLRSDGRKENDRLIISKLLDIQEVEDVQRERECAMCLTEEISVVFLPCAHQVVCRKCNELHEKKGMIDCPSCRTPIQWRICVRSAES